MNLHKTIKAQIIEAMRAKDALRLETLRGLIALFQTEMLNASLPAGTEFLPDDKALALVKRSVKQHKDSIEQFQKGGRQDLVAKEQAELAILEAYLPQTMPREEIKKIVSAKIDALKAAGTFDPKAAGKLTGMLMKELAGKADGADVKAVIDELVKG
jgi:uncharacterized protein YqeY